MRQSLANPANKADNSFYLAASAIKNPTVALFRYRGAFFVRRPSGGGRIRTDDLEVMSLASYRAAPPRVIRCAHSNEHPKYVDRPDEKS